MHRPVETAMKSGHWLVSDKNYHSQAISDMEGVLWYLDQNVKTVRPRFGVPVTACIGAGANESVSRVETHDETASAPVSVAQQQTATIEPRPEAIHQSSRSQAPPPVQDPESVRPEPVLTDWEVVGFWDYDGADAAYLAAGTILRDVAGSGGGATWSKQLELVRHKQLANRNRSLWPVKINRVLKKVCISTPYPTFIAHIDLPGADADGNYEFSSCPGE